MKNKSTSRSASFNLRILIGLAAVLAGVFVALFATSAPGRTRRGEANSSPGVRQGSHVFPNVWAQASSDGEPGEWSWQNPLPQGNDLRGASFIDANTGTVVGYYGTIVRTTDAGNSWTIQTSGTTENLWAVSFTDANNGTAAGEGVRFSGPQMEATIGSARPAGQLFSFVEFPLPAMQIMEPLLVRVAQFSEPQTAETPGIRSQAEP